MKNGLFIAGITVMSIVLLTVSLAPTAEAAIVKFQQDKSCQVDGLDGQDSVQGGVHCDGDNPFSLTDLLNGSLALWVGDSQTPSWNIVNDTGETLESLTLFYFGGLASNSQIDMQTSGTDIFSACTATTADNIVTSDDDCGSDDKTAEDPALALMMEWSGGEGLGVGEVFNLGTSSFAHSGQDAGCFSGTADCLPRSNFNTTVVSEPHTLLLFGIGLAGLGLGRRRRAANRG